MPGQHAIWVVGEVSPDMSRYEAEGADSTRIISQAYGGICTASYAISLRGARKALYKLSMLPFNGPVDWGMKDLCRAKSYDFNCIAPYPQIVGTFLLAGKYGSNSDIGLEVGFPSDGPDDNGYARSVAFSTKHNAERLLKGVPNYQNSFNDTLAQNLTIDEISAAVGHELIVPLSPYADLTDSEEEVELDWSKLPF